MSNATTIANTIKQQIGFNTLMCIGAHNLIIAKECERHQGGLGFKIGRNPKMKQGGAVLITLSFDDTYRVKIVSSRGKVMLEQEGIYCDQLAGRHGVIEQVTG